MFKTRIPDWFGGSLEIKLPPTHPQARAISWKSQGGYSAKHQSNIGTAVRETADAQIGKGDPNRYD
jgi:hypothetical protein